MSLVSGQKKNLCSVSILGNKGNSIEEKCGGEKVYKENAAFGRVAEWYEGSENSVTVLSLLQRIWDRSPA